MNRGIFAAEKESIFAPSKLWLVAVLGIILGCGLGARLYDLKDPPLDYAATRQLRSAMIARGKYYQIARNVPDWKRDVAIRMGKHAMIEPTVMETITAGTYWIVGTEQVWIARIYSSIFWVLGGIAVYALSKEMTGVDGAIIGLVYYLFAPFGVIASRSFQPDPLMTAAIAFTWWTFYRWHKSHTWRWAVFAGLSAGITMFVKSTSIFFLLGGMAVLVLMRARIRKNIKDHQMWLIVVLSGLPVLLYHIYGLFIVGSLGEQFQGRIFPQLLIEAQFYRQLKNSIGTVIGHELLLIPAVLGLILLRSKENIGYLLGIFAGYVIYILTFSYHSTTHYYYHLPFIPLMAIAISSFSKYFLKVFHHPITNNLIRVFVVITILLGVGGTYYRLFKEDYRNEQYFYSKVANKVERDAKIAVLSQSYGGRISYFGWITPKVWLGTGDQEHTKLKGGELDPFEQKFSSFTKNVDYFIVTWQNELEKQKRLHDKLNEHQIYDQGGGYVIFDLNEKIENE